jgi:hypothetical protein
MLNNSGLFQFGHTVYIGYSRSGGGDTFPETFSSTNVADGASARSSFTTTIASVPADVTGIYLVIDSMPANITITGVLFEFGATLDTYFDGSYSNSFWDGATDLTPSTYRLLAGVSIFGTDRPATRDNEDGNNYTLGTFFSLVSNANALKVHWHAPNTPNPGSLLPVQWQIWNITTSTIIKSGTFPDTLVWGTWNEVPVSALSFTTGILYGVTVVTDRYTATSHYFDSAVDHPPLHVDVGGGRFHGQGSTTTPIMPDSGFNNGGYFVDIEVVAGSPPAGLQLSVWNGSAEVGATLSVWNGSAEVPAVLDSIV